MENPVEKFNERARFVLALAQQEAIGLGHQYIGTEHLLLGLLRLSERTAAPTLIDIGAELLRTRKIIAKLFAQGQPPSAGWFGTTLAAQTVLERAADEAQKRHHRAVGPGHLLFSLVSEDDNSAVKVLNVMGVGAERVREAANALLALGDNSEAVAHFTASYGKLASNDLVEMARQDSFDPLIGRETSMSRLIQILTRRDNNRVLIIGQPGVGKTALVEGFAQKLARQDVPESLHYHPLVALDLSPLLALLEHDFDLQRLEGELARLINALKASQPIIFLDELQKLVIQNSVGLFLLLRSVLSRSQLPVVAIINHDDYFNDEKWRTLLSGFFKPLMLDEPSAEETLAILRGVRSRYEAFHKLSISEAALEKAVEVASSLQTRRHLPDKALDLIDEASSQVQLRYSLKSHPNLEEMQAGLVGFEREYAIALANDQSQLADDLLERIEAIRVMIAERQTQEANRIVTPADIDEVAELFRPL